jgi:hypothetical protein
MQSPLRCDVRWGGSSRVAAHHTSPPLYAIARLATYLCFFVILVDSPRIVCCVAGKWSCTKDSFDRLDISPGFSCSTREFQMYLGRTWCYFFHIQFFALFEYKPLSSQQGNLIQERYWSRVRWPALNFFTSKWLNRSLLSTHTSLQSTS